MRTITAVIGRLPVMLGLAACVAPTACFLVHAQVATPRTRAGGGPSSSPTSPSAGGPSSTYLADLTRIGLSEQNGWWSDRGELVLGGLSGKPAARKPLMFEGVHSRHGIYLSARPSGEASITYRLGKRFGSFRSEAIIPEMFPHQGNPRTPLVLEVRGDGRTLWKSRPLARKGDHQAFSVSVEGIDELSLIVACRGPENWGLAAWVEPRLSVSGLDGGHGPRTGRGGTDEAGPKPMGRFAAGGKIEVQVGEQKTVIPEGRFDFRFFPDQPISVLGTKPLRFLLVVPPRTLLMQGPSFETARPVRPVLQGSNRNGAYDQKDAAINSIHIDRDNREILAFFHAERPTGGVGFGGTVRFYASVGLAVSGSEEIDFRKVGPIITGVPEDANSSQTAQGAGEPSACVDHTGEWLYLYYTDHSRRDPLTRKERGVVTCMARCKVSNAGRPGKWEKYYNGAFSEPGLGGRDAEVADCWGASVTYVPELKKYIMVGSRDGICYFTSDDGVRWTKGGTLVEANDVPVIGEAVAFHPMLHVERGTPGEAVGQLFYAYSPRFSRPRMQVPGHTHFFVKRPIRLRLMQAD